MFSVSYFGFRNFFTLVLLMLSISCLFFISFKLHFSTCHCYVCKLYFAYASPLQSSYCVHLLLLLFIILFLNCYSNTSIYAYAGLYSYFFFFFVVVSVYSGWSCFLLSSSILFLCFCFLRMPSISILCVDFSCMLWMFMWCINIIYVFQSNFSTKVWHQSKLLSSLLYLNWAHIALQSLKSLEMHSFIDYYKIMTFWIWKKKFLFQWKAEKKPCVWRPRKKNLKNEYKNRSLFDVFEKIIQLIEINHFVSFQNLIQWANLCWALFSNSNKEKPHGLNISVWISLSCVVVVVTIYFFLHV